jgi:hypothetical protein
MKPNAIGTATRLARLVCLLLFLGLVSACTSSAPVKDGPKLELEEMTQAMNCPMGTKASCIQRVHEPYRCVCMDDQMVKTMMDRRKFESIR